MVDPSLISNKNMDLDAPFDYGDVPIDSIMVADGHIHYKPTPAMKEVVFEDRNAFLDFLRESMRTAAKNLEFEEAARIRDQIGRLEKELD